MSATMTSITCPNCGHTADDHKPGRGCLDCQCMYDPRQILLERITQLAAKDAVIDAAMEVVKWLDRGGYYCPVCGTRKVGEHDEGCEMDALAAALEQLAA